MLLVLVLMLMMMMSKERFRFSNPRKNPEVLLFSEFQLIKNFLNSSYSAHYGGSVSDSLLNILWSVTVSVYLVGGCAGAFSAGWLANKFGRYV